MWCDWRRWLVYTHRWLGIAGGLLFAVWFVSGIVLMYAGMPELTESKRLQRLPVLDLSLVSVAPGAAAASVGGGAGCARAGRQARPGDTAPGGTRGNTRTECLRP